MKNRNNNTIIVSFKGCIDRVDCSVFTILTIDFLFCAEFNISLYPFSHK
jgi:hypothetical protein